MQKTCHIFAAGKPGVAVRPCAGDLVIAADAGYRHLAKLGLSADLVVGDFDSLGYVPAGEHVEQHPVHKDDTDTMLAVRLGLERGCRRFCIYGGLGGERFDHALANVQTLAFLTAAGAAGFLCGARETVTMLSGNTLRFLPGGRDTVSVFAYGGNAGGVTLRGLLYPLENALLTPDFPLGVSNAFTGEAASVFAASGRLLVCWQGGLDRLAPQEER